MTFGDRVRQRRKTLGLTQLALAKAASLSQPTIWRIEQGELHELKHGALGRLAAVLDTTMDYLGGRTEISAPLGAASDSELQALVEYLNGEPPVDEAAMRHRRSACCGTRGLPQKWPRSTGVGST